MNGFTLTRKVAAPEVTAPYGFGWFRPCRRTLLICRRLFPPSTERFADPDTMPFSSPSLTCAIGNITQIAAFYTLPLLAVAYAQRAANSAYPLQ